MAGRSNGAVTGVEGKTRLALWGGTVAGLFAGFVLVVFNLVVDFARGRDPWVVLKVAAYPFLRERALGPGFDLGPVLHGLTTHMGIAAIWGVLFGLTTYGMSRSATVAYGGIWGIVVWIGMFYFVLPLAWSSVLVRGVPTVLALGQHLLFGLALGMGFLPYQRTVIRRTVWSQHTPVRVSA
jgi:hypothetical protein